MADGETNPMCDGAYDREREPHICGKVGWCNPLVAVGANVQYNGTDSIIWAVMTLLVPCAGHLWAPVLCVKYPLKEAGDNLSTSPDENLFCAKGCLDRDRSPPHLAKIAGGWHYNGFGSLPGILTAVPCLWWISWINIFLTFTTTGAKTSMVGAPTASGGYGATNASARASAAERGSRR